MKKVEFIPKTSLKVENIEGFMVRRVTKFGTSAKVDCPKQYLDKTVYLVILSDGYTTSTTSYRKIREKR